VRALTQIITILRKDVLIEMRSKEVVITMLIFSLAVVVIFNFIFDPGSELVQSAAPGILWVAIMFASNLGLARTFAREQENGMMQGLLLCPVDRSFIYLAKVIGNIIFIFFVELVTLPIMIALFDLAVQNRLTVLLFILLLGTAGFASVGTIFSAISANTRSREIMLPILLFPITIPVMLASIKSTTYLLGGNEIQQVWPWIRLLLGFDIVFFVVCFILYEYVVEE
jgi:heme exporter protein B